jgi:hypothetical protein
MGLVIAADCEGKLTEWGTKTHMSDYPTNQELPVNRDKFGQVTIKIARAS